MEKLVPGTKNSKAVTLRPRTKLTKMHPFGMSSTGHNESGQRCRPAFIQGRYKNSLRSAFLEGGQRHL